MITSLKLQNFDEDGKSKPQDPALPTPEEIEAKIKKAHKQGHIEGYLAGADAGRAEMHQTMQAEHAAMAEKLAQELARLADAMQAHQDALMAQIVGFTLQTCEIVLPEVIERLSTARVKKTVTQSLKMAIGSSQIKVRLSPATLDQIGPDLRQRAVYYKCDGVLDLRADADLPDGDARMEWDHGSLDYGFKKICDRLLAELRDTHARALTAQKEKDGNGQA